MCCKQENTKTHVCAHVDTYKEKTWSYLCIVKWCADISSDRWIGEPYVCHDKHWKHKLIGRKWKGWIRYSSRLLNLSITTAPDDLHSNDIWHLWLHVICSLIISIIFNEGAVTAFAHSVQTKSRVTANTESQKKRAFCCASSPVTSWCPAVIRW